MKSSLTQFFRTSLAAALLMGMTLRAGASKPGDINPHGEPIPGDPLLAYVQRMQCDESLGPVSSAKTHFNWQHDTLCFPNDTFYMNGRDEHAVIPPRADGYPPIYMHRCFVLTKSVIQFHKFVRFDPTAPKLTEEQYVAIIRHVTRIPTWWPAFSKKEAIVVPGYKDLRDFSSARQYAFQQNIGWWLITYGRIGNWRMMFPSIPALRDVAARQIMENVDRGNLQAVYLSIFPRMNHCVVIYDYARLKDGNIVFWDYDPNYHNASSWLVYDVEQREFLLQKRWFFPGGVVKLMRTYISPVH